MNPNNLPSQRFRARQVTSKSVSPRGDTYNPSSLTDFEANEMWRRCIKKIHFAILDHHAVGSFRVHGKSYELSFMLNQKGHLERFWLRLAGDNTLVIVGNARGLLPLNAGANHAA